MFDLTSEHPITLKQAAALLGVCRRTIDRHVKRGLEVRKIGGRLYTSRESIQRFSEPVQIEGKRAVNSRTRTAVRMLRERHGIDLRLKND